MVAPELGHYLEKLALSEDRPQDRGTHQFAQEQVLLVFEHLTGGLRQCLKSPNVVFTPRIIDLLWRKLLFDESLAG
jgi:hypothetical protein